MAPVVTRGALLAVVVVVLLVVGCGQPASSPTTSASPTPRPSLQFSTVETTSQPPDSVLVELTNYEFKPSNISVKAGRVVIYLLNTSNEVHSMSLRDEAGPLLSVAAQSTPVLAGHAAVFTIDDLPAGTYRVKEPIAGLHPSNNSGMVGVLTSR